METNLMARSTVERAYATMLKHIPTDSSLVVNKVTLSFAREGITSLKCNGDSEKRLENIMDLSMPCREIPNRKNTSCQ